MPIYEYACDSCGHKLEAMQKMSDQPLQTCPSCGAESLKKLISAAGFRLKGSGWYETDFKGSKSKTAESKQPSSDSNSVPACSTAACPAAPATAAAT